MRVRNATTVLGLGAFVLVCLVPEPAQAQLLRRGNSAPSYYQSGPMYGQSWQPGSYGSPSYWPGSTYGPGVSYGPGMSYPPGVSYGMGAVPLQERAGGAGMSYAPDMSYGTQMYQGQQYGYQSPGTPCPPQQPISSSALTSTPPQAMPGAATAQPGTTTPQQVGTAQTVTIQDNSYESNSLTIQTGATVTWMNRGQRTHTVTFDVGRDSGDIAPGGSFSATFPHAGTYSYHCHHHPDMKGTVVVREGTGAGGTGKTGDSSGAKY
jgi:plastocyanin